MKHQEPDITVNVPGISGYKFLNNRQNAVHWLYAVRPGRLGGTESVRTILGESHHRFVPDFIGGGSIAATPAEALPEGRTSHCELLQRQAGEGSQGAAVVLCLGNPVRVKICDAGSGRSCVWRTCRTWWNHTILLGSLFHHRCLTHHHSHLLCSR